MNELMNLENELKEPEKAKIFDEFDKISNSNLYMLSNLVRKVDNIKYLKLIIEAVKE